MKDTEFLIEYNESNIVVLIIACTRKIYFLFNYIVLIVEDSLLLCIFFTEKLFVRIVVLKIPLYISFIEKPLCEEFV